MKKIDEQRLAIKYLMIVIHLIILTILFVGFYKVYKAEKTIRSFNVADNVEEYTYINVGKMSEAFAVYEETGVTMHIAIEEEDTGMWHAYIIAIDKNNYDKYKEIIKYSYGETKDKPNPVKTYGYPVVIDDNLKELAIKNISKFLPKENKIEINEENYEKYLTNCYLDSTKDRKQKFSYKLTVISFLLFFFIILLFLILFDKDFYVDRILKKHNIVKKKKNTNSGK